MSLGSQIRDIVEGQESAKVSPAQLLAQLKERIAAFRAQKVAADSITDRRAQLVQMARAAVLPWSEARSAMEQAGSEADWWSQDPVIKELRTTAENFLNTELPAVSPAIPALLGRVETKLAPALTPVVNISSLLHALNKLNEESLAFKVLRPWGEIPPEGIKLTEGGTSVLYLPQKRGGEEADVSQAGWPLVQARAMPILEAWAKAEADLKGLRDKATKDFFLSDALAGGTGILYVPAYPGATLLTIIELAATIAEVVPTGRKDITVGTKIHLRPPDFPGFPPSIRQTLSGWYRRQEERAMARGMIERVLRLGEITGTQLLNEGVVGRCAFFHPKAPTLNGVEELAVCFERSEEGGGIFFRNFTSPSGAFASLEKLIGMEISLQPVEGEELEIGLLRKLLLERPNYEAWKVSQQQR